MSTELEEAAAKWLNNDADISPDDNSAHCAVEGFIAGSQYQSKKDEEILNSFFSREAVLEVMQTYQRYYHDSLATMTRPDSVAEWFDKNYPPKTHDHVPH